VGKDSTLASMIKEMAKSGIFKKMKRSKVVDEKFTGYPLSIDKIIFRGGYSEKDVISDIKVGDYAAVRPCGEEYKNKTYLGYFVGDIPIGVSALHDPKENELTVSLSSNPAFFLPDIREVIFGCGSFWSKIKTPDDLRQITDFDIDSVWYVQALKALADKE